MSGTNPDPRGLVTEIERASGLSVHSGEDLPFEVRHLDDDAKSRYRNSMLAGYGQKWAIMVACQQPPGTAGTDRTLMEGKLHGGHFDNLPAKQAERMMREAKAAGIQTKGREYMSGLADKRGHRDPEAWIDSAADVLRVAKKRRLHVRGSVNYDPPEQAPPKRVDINPKLVNQLAKQEMAANPGMRRADAVEAVKKRHTLKRKL